MCLIRVGGPSLRENVCFLYYSSPRQTRCTLVNSVTGFLPILSVCWLSLRVLVLAENFLWAVLMFCFLLVYLVTAAHGSGTFQQESGGDITHMKCSHHNNFQYTFLNISIHFSPKWIYWQFFLYRVYLKPA